MHTPKWLGKLNMAPIKLDSYPAKRLQFSFTPISNNIPNR